MNCYDSNNEKVDILSHVRCTGYLCRKNSMVAADLYLQKYPNFSHIFVYLNFLQNGLALIVGTVGCE
jgi:hypothetical protein